MSSSFVPATMMLCASCATDEAIAPWRNPSPTVRYGRLVFALVGVGFAAYLVYAELFVINAICLWCTAVHLLTLLLFGVIAFGTALLPNPTDQ